MPLPRRNSEDQVTATFLRGLTIGALVGAIIAGSSMLTRRRVARQAVQLPTSEGETGPATMDATAGPEPERGDRDPS